MSKIYDTNGKEVSVSWAAKRIQCSERSILYYLKECKLSGIKVGKSWFIDRASVEAHCTRYGIPEASDNSQQEDKTVSESAEALQQNPTAEAENTRQNAEAPSATQVNDNLERKRRPVKPITTLKVYKLFETAISEASTTIKAGDRDPCLERIYNLQLSALEALGAGYYSQGYTNKHKHYMQARSHIGGIVSILRSCPELTDRMKNYIKKCEEDVIPALSALIRYIEKDIAEGKPNFRKPKEVQVSN